MRLVQHLYNLIALACIVASAYVSIDVGWEVPITGQTLAVLVVAYLAPMPILVVVIYLILGIVGFPVFADGESGWSVFVGSSMGYLLGMLASVAYIYYYRNRQTDTLPIIAQRKIIGTLIILIAGATWLSITKSLSIAIQYGVVPYLPGASVKIVVGTIIVYAALLYRRAVLSPSR